MVLSGGKTGMTGIGIVIMTVSVPVLRVPLVFIEVFPDPFPDDDDQYQHAGLRVFQVFRRHVCALFDAGMLD